jgi:hypothetical protein
MAGGLSWGRPLDPLTAPDLALYGFPQQIGPFLSRLEHGINARQRPRGESRWHLFLIYSLTSHMVRHS